MDNREARKRAILRNGSLILLFFLLVSIALLLISYWDKQQGYFPTQGDYWSMKSEIEYNGKTYVRNDDIETMLIVGLDKYTNDEDNDSYTNDRQADFLMLFILDNGKKTCSAIQINRDTMTPVNVLGVAGRPIDSEIKQIALAHTYGSGDLVSLRNTADAVSELLFDLEVDHYVSVTLDVVQQVNDSVGGVEVEVMGDFTGIDDTLVEGERVLLMGKQAMTYIRARMGMDDPTNIARMARQRQYLNALFQQVQKTADADPEYVAQTVLAASEHMQSNTSVTDLQKLFEKVSDYEFSEIYAPEGESIVGEQFMEFYPDMEKLKKRMVELVYIPK